MDKIRIDTLCLDNLAVQFRRVGDELAEAAGTLNRITMEEKSGAQVHCAIPSVKLTLSDAYVYAGKTTELVRRFSSALSNTADAATRLNRRTRELTDIFMDCEHGIIRRINGISQTSASTGKATQAAQAKRDALDRTLKMLDNAVAPDQLPSVQNAEKLKKDWLYQGGEWFYSILTGDVQNAGASQETRMKYLFDSLLAGCMDEEVPFIQAMDITGDFITAIADKTGLDVSVVQMIAEVVDVGELSGVADKVGGIAGYTSIAVENFVNYVNQMVVLNTMNEDAARSMAAAYQNASDPSMQAVGRAVENLLNSSMAEKVVFMTGKHATSTEIDLGEKVAYDVIKKALGGNLAGRVWTGTADITGAVVDGAVNAGDYAERSNALIYSSDAVQAMYDGFQRDYDAYKSNPTDDNLSRAVESYKAYKRTIANSFDAMADYTQTATDSVVGRLISSDSARNADEIARSAAAHHRDSCGDIDNHFKEYTSINS